MEDDNMTTTWRLGIDWNRNGVICWDAQPGDALNLFPQPLRYMQLDWRTDVATSVARVMQESEYGLYALQVTTGTGTTNGLIVGQTNAGVAAARPADAVLNIQVTASTAYRFSVRVRGLSTYSGVNFRLRVKDQAGTTLVTSSAFVLTADWQVQAVAFTTGVSATYLVVEIVKDTDATDVTFQATGFMLVQSTTLPAYNAGQATSRYDNITAHVMNLDWFVGIHKTYQLDADDSRMTIVVSNADRLFSPEYVSSPLYGTLVPQRPVVLQSWDGTTRRTHWTGWIESLSPKTNVYGERTVEIVCAGAMRFFEDALTQIALQENKRTNELMETLLDQVPLPTPLTQTTLLDVTGHCELDSNALLPDRAIDRTLETGKTTLAFAADNWVRRGTQDEKPDPFNAYRAMKDVVAAERGRFFFNREGAAMFWSRHHSILSIVSQATFNDTMTDLTYEYAGRDDFANHVTVTYHPRTISETSNFTLWQLDAPVTVGPNQEHEVSVSYRDDSQNRIGGRDVSIGESSFSQGSAELFLKDIGANRATLRILNRSLGQQAVLASCSVQGQKITDFGELESDRRDEVSIAYYGERKLEMRLQSVDNTDQAESVTTFELMRRKDPAGHVQSITLRSHGLEGGLSHAHQLARTIGDGIKIIETQTGHTGDYFIIGERHRLSESGSLLETTWQLEPAVQGDWFLLNDDLLDGGARVLY